MAGVSAPDSMLHFAYSAVLDPSTRERWQREQAFSQPDWNAGLRVTVPDVELCFPAYSSRWNGRIAGLRAKTGASVEGLLLPLGTRAWEDVAQLEALSGCPMDPVNVRVQLTDTGEWKTATAFTPRLSTSADSGDAAQADVSESYLDALVRGAQSANLSEGWIARLQEEAAIVRKLQQFGRQHNLKGVP